MQPELLSQLSKLNLAPPNAGAQLQAGDQGHPVPRAGQAQGQALLKLLQGPGAHANGYGHPPGAGLPAGGGGSQLLPFGGSSGGGGGDGRLAAAAVLGHQQHPQSLESQDGELPSHLEQAVGSLFGTGGSIWSSQPGAAGATVGSTSSEAASQMGGGGGGGLGLWGPSLDWAAPQQQQQQQQQQQPGYPNPLMMLLQQQQQQQQQQVGQHPAMQQQPVAQHPGLPPPQQPPGMPPPHQQRQTLQPPYQPPLQYAPPHHLAPPQHPGVHAQHALGPLPPLAQQQQQGMLPSQQQLQQYPAYLQQQPPPQAQQQQHQQQQHQQYQKHQHQQLPPHLQHPHGLLPPPQQQQRPIMPYGHNPLSALLQQQQPGAGRPPSTNPLLQQQQAPGMPPGGWGAGAMFAGLPAMQHLQQQQPQPQQHMPGGVGRKSPPFPPQQLHANQAGLQQQQQQPRAGLFEGMLRAAVAPQPAATRAAAAPSPPLLHAEQQQRQQQQQQGPASEQRHSSEADRLGRAAAAAVAATAARKPGAHPAAKPVPGRENRWVDVMDRQHDGRQPKANMQDLNGALTQLADSLMPTPEEHATMMSAFEAVRALLVARWPGARVHLFGSVANGLSVRHNNDLDVCLELEEVQQEDLAGKGEVASAVGELMEAAGMADVLPLPRARVPVVKFVVPRTGTKVDVTVNNLLACVNTKLLADYCAIDPRLAPLVALVKHWAKQRAVNDPYRGTLSSYCYVLMCIHLLQSRPTPVLPALQQLPPTFRRTIGQWTCQFCDNVESLRGFGAANRESLGQLVWAFFEYWAWRHNYSHDVISIRLGTCLHKDDKDWTRRIGNERHLVCIEDPFEVSHDLGRTVDRQTRAVLHKEFTRAATLLRDAEDPLDLLFQPYRVGSRG